MRLVLCALSALSCARVRAVFDGSCPRRDPPPGVLLLSSGTDLLLTCKGHVTVNGAKVDVSASDSGPRVSVAPTRYKANFAHTDSSVNEVYNISPQAKVGTAPRRPTAPPTSAPPTTKGDWDAEEGEGGGSRVTRGIRTGAQWKLNRNVGGRGLMFAGKGAELSLFSLRESDSGRYSCHYRGTERFSLKVVVADPPEKPRLSCHKRSPSSKMRCEWTPQRPVSKNVNCSLMMSKRPSDTFQHYPCSYSSRSSRYWCALDHNEDELRKTHTAYLCSTSVAGNTTSNLLIFTPFNILKPDPPSDIKVTAEDGHETVLKVKWNFPVSWKPQDRFYKLIYEVKYQPSGSRHAQVKMIKEPRSCIITNAMPGFMYLIQLRTKEEFDGVWSEWSSPVNASSWTAVKPSEELMTTMFPEPIEEGSTDEDYTPDDPELVVSGLYVSHYILWILGFFLVLSILLAVFMYRRKDRLMSKLHRVSNLMVQSGDSAQAPPPAPAAMPEGQALVTIVPRGNTCNSSSGEREEENEEEERLEERTEESTEVMHFNNTSYFFTQPM